MNTSAEVTLFPLGCYVCQCAVLVGDIVGRERMAPGVGTLFGIKSIPLMLGAPIAGIFAS